ncbi:MAG: hypothetical protein Q7R99_02500 [bacterium]|nr:hypothetical protein [bacterium]
MNEDIEKLIELTTIIKVFDNISQSVIHGGENYVDRFNQAHSHVFQDKQHNQTDLSDLEKHWENKWQSLGDSWSKKIQNYQFLYDSFKLFYVSFQQVKLNKELSITTGDNHKKEIHFNELSGASLYGMYYHGNKCVKLLNQLKLINTNHPKSNFLKKFSETRNTLVEHNYNPTVRNNEKRQKLNLQIDPSIWSLVSTGSLMEISIHGTAEKVFDAYIDYYEDYYDLEKIILDIVRLF